MRILILAILWGSSVFAKGGDGMNNGGGRLELNAMFGQERLAYFLKACAADPTCEGGSPQAASFKRLDDRLSDNHPSLLIVDCEGHYGSLPGFRGTETWNADLTLCREAFNDAQGEPTFKSLGEVVGALTEAWLLKAALPFSGAENLQRYVDSGSQQIRVRLSSASVTLDLIQSMRLDGGLDGLYLRDDFKFYDLLAEIRRDSPCAKLSLPDSGDYRGGPVRLQIFSMSGETVDLILSARLEAKCGSRTVVGDYRFDMSLLRRGESLAIQSIRPPFTLVR